MSGTMRITGGSLVRRRFKVPEAADQGLVRPTSDRVREAIFSSLGSSLVNAQVLDLFGGSGAYGFESISRGAKNITCVEMSRETAACIRDNIQSLDLEKSYNLVMDDAQRFVKHPSSKKFDIIFVDPPYTLRLEAIFWENLKPWLNDDAIVVFRCKSLGDFTCPNEYDVVREKTYGGTAVIFLTLRAPISSE